MNTQRPSKEFAAISKILIGTGGDIPGHLQLIVEVLLDIRELLSKDK